MNIIIFLSIFFISYSTSNNAIENSTYPFQLPKLDYTYRSLTPHIDTRTMKVHYEKHHQGYVQNLNKTLASYPELQQESLENLLISLSKYPKPLRDALKNFGGGHYNHSLFWRTMSPHKTNPSGQLYNALIKNFGSLENFKHKFSQEALKVFGSGWTWLCLNKKNNTLIIKNSHDQETPLTQDLVPLLGLDLWEHAYYLKYQNNRSSYIDAWWHVINWPYVQERFLENISLL